MASRRFNIFIWASAYIYAAFTIIGTLIALIAVLFAMAWMLSKLSVVGVLFVVIGAALMIWIAAYAHYLQSEFWRGRKQFWFGKVK